MKKLVAESIEMEKGEKWDGDDNVTTVDNSPRHRGSSVRAEPIDSSHGKWPLRIPCATPAAPGNQAKTVNQCHW